MATSNPTGANAPVIPNHIKVFQDVLGMNPVDVLTFLNEYSKGLSGVAKILYQIGEGLNDEEHEDIKALICVAHEAAYNLGNSAYSNHKNMQKQYKAFEANSQP
jgi:hypothetical protein